MNKHLVITVGIPASGKSTLADEYGNQGYSILEKDHFREQRYLRGETWSKMLERDIVQEHRQKLADLMKMGLNIIIADTNLNVALRQGYENMASEFGYTVDYEICHIDFATAMERNDRRTGWKSVPHEAMRGMYVKMIDQFPVEYVPDPRLPPALVFDIDGTLAHRNGRKPFDWDKVLDDKPDEAVLEILMSVAGDIDVILLSGRDAVSEADTRTWLGRLCVPYQELHMRQQGSILKDTCVKHDMFHKYVAPKYNVWGVFDDRPSVCRMWRSINVKTFQVGDPHKEF